jgi:hypothetical protein
MVVATLRASAQTDQPIYTDSLQNGWVPYGWTQIDYNNASPVHSGSKSIAVTITNDTYQAIYIHHTAFDTTPYSALTFWINGGASGGQQLNAQAELNGAGQTAVPLAALAANTWTQITIPLSSLGVAGQPNMDGFWIQDAVGSAKPTFYLDDITLLANTNVTIISNTAVAIQIDAQLNQHPISPLVYGVAFATSNQLADLNCPLNRSGGNAETSYNWQLNAHNHAADWYFESIDDGSATAGASADDFVANSKNGGAQPMITIPMIGWAPKLGPQRGKLASYSISKYGLQAANDWQWYPDAGNGIVTNTTAPITTNDKNDANVPVDSNFESGYVQHLMSTWGASTNGGVHYYLMDNEHSIWHSTHQDVHPVGATMQEIRDKFLDYAGMIKSNDPAALICAPEEWGWSGYFYSGYDQQYGGQYGWSYLPDRSTNGGWNYLPWLLNQLHQRATNTNQRLLDYFTVHCYPQSGEFSSDISTSTQLLRNRSTRSLWDTNYVDASWINSVVELIPRLKSWVAAYYPGTKTGITEYNWGGEANINGATTQADLFGIFGREGLDLATRWTTPDASTPTYKAMKMYRNYDGLRSGFGDTSVSASDPNPDNVSTFAALRSSDGALTVMVINKQLSANAGATLNLTNFLSAGTAQVWQLTASNVISRLSDISFIGNSLSNSLPSQSVTLLVLPAGARPRLAVVSKGVANQVNVTLSGQSGQWYTIESSTNLTSWTYVLKTNLITGSLLLSLPNNAAQIFYRAKWAP